MLAVSSSMPDPPVCLSVCLSLCARGCREAASLEGLGDELVKFGNQEVRWLTGWLTHSLTHSLHFAHSNCRLNPQRLCFLQSVEKILGKGIELRSFAVEVEENLKAVELESIQVTSPPTDFALERGDV